MEGEAVEADEMYVGGKDKKKHVHNRAQRRPNVYVMGDARTNSIEGCWGLVKRGIGGAYHSASRKCLQSYLDECAFRYNRRDAQESMFVSLPNQISGRAI